MTPSGGRKAGVFSLNALDFASLQSLFERVAETWLPPRLTGYLKGLGLYVAKRGCDEISSYYFFFFFVLIIIIIVIFVIIIIIIRFIHQCTEWAQIPWATNWI